MWVGTIIWEKQPWQVAAIHCGDWLGKVVLIAFILGVWSRGSIKHDAEAA